MKMKKENTITYSTDEAELKVVKVDFEKKNNMAFIVSDVYAAMRDLGIESDIISIVSLKSDIKNEGFGSAIIKDFINDNMNSVIVVKAEPMYYSQEDFDIAMKNGNFDKSVEELSKFYEKNNFVDINDYVGYEFGKAYIYNNKFGAKIADYVGHNESI